MRIVRFHFEPWQKGASVTTTPSASPTVSLLVLSPKIQRRQRTAEIDDIPNIDKIPKEIRDKQLRDRLKYRYPKMVERLASICGDVIAQNVEIS